MVSERSRRCRAVPARGCCEPKDVHINQRPRLIFRRLYFVHRNRALLLCSSRSLLFTASNPYTSKRLICITKTKNSVSGFACSLLDRQPIIRSKNGRARVCRVAHGRSAASQKHRAWMRGTASTCSSCAFFAPCALIEIHTWCALAFTKRTCVLENCASGGSASGFPSSPFSCWQFCSNMPVKW